MTLDERIHALIFNGITKASAEDDGFDSWLPLSERERFTRAVVDELRAGNIEFRLGPLALLADAAATEARRNPHCSNCGDTRGGPVGHEISECTWDSKAAAKADPFPACDGPWSCPGIGREARL